MACQAACPELEPLPCHSFEDMLGAVQEGRAARAMVPVENSVAGRVADIHHLLPESGLFITGEHFQRVNAMLLGVKGSSIDQVKEIHSHVHALGQSRKLMRELEAKPVQHPDTAGAARDVAAPATPRSRRSARASPPRSTASTSCARVSRTRSTTPRGC
jgi:prephenate dehydratase